MHFDECIHCVMIFFYHFLNDIKVYILISLIIHLSIFISSHIINHSYCIYLHTILIDLRDYSEQENERLGVTYFIMKHFIVTLIQYTQYIIKQ